MASRRMPCAASSGSNTRSPASLWRLYCGPASYNMRCVAVLMMTALPCPMSAASNSNSPWPGQSAGQNSAGIANKAATQRSLAGSGAISNRPAPMASTLAHQAGCGKAQTAPGHVASHCSKLIKGSMAVAASAAAVGTSAASNASGVTIKVTQGIATRLASKPTMETCPNSSKPSGASASEISHCSRQSAASFDKNRFVALLSSVGAAPASVASSTPTATKLSQKPACHSAHGSATTTTASASSQTHGHGQRTPHHCSRATTASMHTVRCAGSPQPLNMA